MVRTVSRYTNVTYYFEQCHYLPSDLSLDEMGRYIEEIVPTIYASAQY